MPHQNSPPNIAVVIQESDIGARLLADPPSGVKIIECTDHDTRLDRLTQADALITESWAPVPNQAPNLQWIQLLSVGYDHLDQAVLSHPGWSITHGGGASAVPIAEWCVGMMLRFAHRFDDIANYQRHRSWWSDRIRDMTSTTLRNAVVGILGYGAIGQEVARQCAVLGMQVHASLGRHGKKRADTFAVAGTGDPNGKVPVQWFAMDQFAEAVGAFDYLVLSLRSTAATENIINKNILGRCKNTAILINPARGDLIDDTALTCALSQGQIGGAALDVFRIEPLPSDSPLYGTPNIVISPHCSPESAFFRHQLDACIRQNIGRFASGKPLVNLIQ